MPVRQYEKLDCLEEAFENQSLKIVRFSMPANMGGECDEVIGFGNPLTKNIVWVPYNSKIDIECKDYKIIRGKLRSYYGDRIYTRDQDINCITDSKNKLYSMSDFLNKEVIIEELYKSRWGSFFQDIFDRRHLKNERPAQTLFGSLSQERRGRK